MYSNVREPPYSISVVEEGAMLVDTISPDQETFLLRPAEGERGGEEKRGGG